MSKRTFTDEQIIELSRNSYIQNISPKAITYSDEFKVHFLAEWKKGKPALQIFAEAGLPVEILGEQRIHNAASRWKKAYQESGITGVRDQRKRQEKEEKDRRWRDRVLEAMAYKRVAKGARAIVMYFLNTKKVVVNRKKIQRIMRKYGLQCPIRRGNCWDNAPQESYFGHLKDEIPYEELRAVIASYMDYYNHERGQWKLKKLTPVSYRDQLLRQTV